MSAHLHKHGGNVYEALRQSKGNLVDLLDYSANINPLGLSSSVMAAIQGALNSIIHYPDTEACDLKSAISAHYEVDSKLITAGNGAIELLYVLCHTLKPRRVLVPAPTFNEYERAARAAGAEVEYLYLSAENGFAIDIELLATKLADVDIVFLGNPNNPTGTLLTRDQIERLLITASKYSTYIVVDESFIDFLPNDGLYTSRPLLDTFPNLVIIHSLTKFYAIPGLRLGFALSNQQLTDKLHAGKDPWNVNCLAQAAGVAALGDHIYQQETIDFITMAKDNLYSDLLGLPGLKPYLPSVNFLLLDISGTGFKAVQLKAAMFEQSILVRDCSNYPGLTDTYIRLAIKAPAQNQRLLTALKQIIR